MGGSIINTRGKKHYAIMKKKDKQKTDRAKVCIGCESNREGYCLKHTEWCFKVNYICLKVKNPYEYKIPIRKSKTRKNKTSKQVKNT